MTSVFTTNPGFFDPMPERAADRSFAPSEIRDIVLGECESCGGDDDVHNVVALIHRLMETLKPQQQSKVIEMLGSTSGMARSVSGRGEDEDLVESAIFVRGDEPLSGAVMGSCVDGGSGEDELVDLDGTEHNDEPDVFGAAEGIAVDLSVEDPTTEDGPDSTDLFGAAEMVDLDGEAGDVNELGEAHETFGAAERKSERHVRLVTPIEVPKEPVNFDDYFKVEEKPQFDRDAAIETDESMYDGAQFNDAELDVKQSYAMDLKAMEELFE